MEYPPNLHAFRPCLEQMKSVETLDDKIPIGKKIPMVLLVTKEHESLDSFEILME
jgi:hypothetical protein